MARIHLVENRELSPSAPGATLPASAALGPMATVMLTLPLDLADFIFARAKAAQVGLSRAGAEVVAAGRAALQPEHDKEHPAE